MSATLGDELQDLFDELSPEEIGENLVDAINALRKKPSEVVAFDTSDGGNDKFSDFLEDVKKAGLNHKEFYEDHGGPGVVVVNA